MDPSTLIPQSGYQCTTAKLGTFQVVWKMEEKHEIRIANCIE